MRSGEATCFQSISSVPLPLPLPLLPLSVMLPEDMIKVMRRKEDGLTDTKGQTYINPLTELFKLRQWPHTLGVETALSPHGLGPKKRILSWLWHPINPSPLCPITSMHLLPVLLYVALFPDYLYSIYITTDWWVLCLVHLSIRLLNVFPFMIPVTYHSHPNILTNMICLGELATNITKLTHCTVWTVLIVGLPDPPSIAPYILQ